MVIVLQNFIKLANNVINKILEAFRCATCHYFLLFAKKVQRRDFLNMYIKALMKSFLYL